MPEMQSLTFTLMTEALIGFTVIAIILLVITFRRKSRDQKAVSELIENLAESGNSRSKQLQAILERNDNIDAEQIQNILKDVKNSEKNLYQQIINMFVNRDANMLGNIHDKVNDVTKPYITLLENDIMLTMMDQPSSQQNSSKSDESNETSTAEISAKKAKKDVVDTTQMGPLRDQNRRLADQLRLALETMDEVSAEYTKMFGNESDVKELNASKDRMMRAYEKAIHQVIQLAKYDDGDEPDDEDVEQELAEAEQKLKKEAFDS